MLNQNRDSECEAHLLEALHRSSVLSSIHDSAHDMSGSVIQNREL